jgi:hypothetical protein
LVEELIVKIPNSKLQITNYKFQISNYKQQSRGVDWLIGWIVGWFNDSFTQAHLLTPAIRPKGPLSVVATGIPIINGRVGCYKGMPFE